VSKSIYCVLRSGGKDYGEQHVRWLKRQCDRYAPGVPFICLTDIACIEGVETEPLIHRWEGWWSKLELFRFDDVFYLDLDTVLSNDIRFMLELDGFHALRNFGRNGIRGRLGARNIPLTSGVMSWSRSPRHVYENFDPAVADRYRTKRRWGDQGYLYDQLHGEYRALQDVFPGRIHSSKFGAFAKDDPDADIICFHGRPRPWETAWPRVPPLEPQADAGDRRAQ